MSEKIKYPYSVHSFMMPVRWDYLPGNYDFLLGKYSIDFDKRTNLQTFCDKLYNTAWKRKFYRIDNKPENYNEFTYFHAFTTLTLFDLQQADEFDTETVSENKTMIYFEIENTDGDYYKICTNAKDYQLDLSGISLHVFTTGIAILTFNLTNNIYGEPEDILRINEFGRRIYPQFLGKDEPLTDKTKNEFLAKKIEIKCENLNHGLPFSDDFSTYNTLINKETHSINHYGGY